MLFLISVTAYGLISFFDGPHLGRGSDLSAFRDSNIKQRYEDSLRHHNMLPRDYQQLEDKIVHHKPPSFLALLIAYEEDVRDFEKLDSRLRTNVEWVNNKITENWKSITYSKRMKILVGSIAIDVIVAAVLTNALTILHSNQSHVYFSDAENNPFSLEMPSLEEYFQYNPAG